MNRRGFLGNLGKGAVALAGAPLILTPAQADTLPPASLSEIQPGTRHFAVLMNVYGEAIRTMMVDNLPQEINFTSGDQADPTVFRLVSCDRYDGHTIEGLARYIYFKGPDLAWPVIKLGF